MQSTESEKWNPVAGYEGLYEVSDFGRVRSLHNDTPRVLRAALRPDGYLFVTLGNRIKQRGFLVHRLVAHTFLGAPPTGAECCHNDGNPENNHVTNLRWDTPSSNILDQVRHGTHGRSTVTECPRGHSLISPNLRQSSLRRGQRECRACDLARKDSTRPFTIELANERYAQIMAQHQSG